MVRKLSRLALCFVAGVLAVTFSLGAISANEDEKVPSIEDIMKKGHGGKKSLLNQMKNSLKAGEWAAVKTAADEMKGFGEALGKNKPPMGDEESWKKLTAAYKKTTADMAAAAGKEDAKALGVALGTMGKSCKSCHDAHR